MYRSIVLTGASSGIGQALAQRLAKPGIAMLLIARRAAPLQDVAETARAAGASVETAAIDVIERDALAHVVTDFDAMFPVDLLIANAGISAGLTSNRGPEADGVSRQLIETNYMGALNLIEPLLPAMIDRGAGRIVLMSSMAALRPFPDMPSYSATKAGIRAYGIALRGAMREHGPSVSIICPGFVTSPMSKRHRGMKPFEISAERAASIIVRDLEKGRSEIHFPKLLALLAWISNLLPPGISDWFVQGFKARIDPDA